MNPQRSIRSDAGDDPVLAVALHLEAQLKALAEEMREHHGGGDGPPPGGLSVSPFWTKVIGGVTVIAIVAAFSLLIALQADVREIKNTRFTGQEGRELQLEMTRVQQRQVDYERRLTNHETRLDRIEGGASRD